MRKLAIIILFALNVGLVRATDYYYSSINGNDGNTNTSSSTPRLSMEALQTQINAAVVGDRFLFERGSEWNDAMITITSKNNISFLPYGSGSLPIISALGILGTWTPQGGNKYMIYDARLINTEKISPPNMDDLANYYCPTGYLIVGDKIFHVAEYPDGNDNYLAMNGWSTSGTDPYTTAQSFFDNDVNFTTNYWQGGLAQMVNHDWQYDISRISYNSGTSFTLDIYQGGYYWWNFSSGEGKFNKYFIKNHLNAMNLPGEFVYKFSEQKLYAYSTIDLNTVVTKYATKNYALNLNNCSTIDIKGIELQGGNIAAMLERSCTDVTFRDGTLRYAGGNAASLGYQGSNIILVNDSIIDCPNTGIHFKSVSGNAKAQGNYIKRIGVYRSNNLGRKETSGNGITFEYCLGTVTVDTNYVDSCSYSGIHREAYDNTGTPTDSTIRGFNTYNRYNLTKHCNINLNDGAGNYHYRSGRFAYPSVFKNNISLHNGGNAASALKGNNATGYGFYFDEQSNGWLNDSCVAVDNNTGFFSNSPKNLTLSHGIYSDIDRGTTQNVHNMGIYIDYYMGDAYGVKTIVNAQNNTIIEHNTASPIIGLHRSTTLNLYGSIYNNNKYFAINHTGQFNNRVGLGWTDNLIGFSSWKSTFSIDASSTLNGNSWTYNSGWGITPQQAAFVATNWSKKGYWLNLHGITFKDADGTTITDSVLIPRYYGKALFYISGPTANLALLNLEYEGEVMTMVGDTTEEPELGDTIAKINFDYDAANPAVGWVDVYGNVLGAQDSVETQTTGVWFINTAKLSAGGSGNAFTGFPINVSLYYHFIPYTSETPRTYSFTNLDTSNHYKVVIPCIRAAGTSPFPTSTNTFTVGSQSSSVQAVGNTSNSAILTGVHTNANGRIDITFTKAAGYYGYINAMLLIDEGENTYPPPPDPPSGSPVNCVDIFGEPYILDVPGLGLFEVDDN
jgi:hypothetical protein